MIIMEIFKILSLDTKIVLATIINITDQGQSSTKNCVHRQKKLIRLKLIRFLFSQNLKYSQ